MNWPHNYVNILSHLIILFKWGIVSHVSYISIKLLKKEMYKLASDIKILKQLRIQII